MAPAYTQRVQENHVYASTVLYCVLLLLLLWRCCCCTTIKESDWCLSINLTSSAVGFLHPCILLVCLIENLVMCFRRLEMK